MISIRIKSNMSSSKINIDYQSSQKREDDSFDKNVLGEKVEQMIYFNKSLNRQ